MAQQNIGPILLGATGKVGRALRAVWPVETNLLCQHRDEAASDGLFWDILNTPAPDIPYPVNGIIALAGATQGDFQVNTDLALAACELGKRAGGVRVLLASTQAVYGRSTDLLTEQSPCQPTAAYGRAKLAMEHAVKDIPNVTCLRIGNVMGCGALCASMASGRVGLERFAGGAGPARMMIGPADLAQTLLALLAHDGPLPPVMNLAASPIILMQDLLQAAGADWAWKPSLQGGLQALTMDLSLLATHVSVPQTDAHALVTQARATGWDITRS